jgi:hypothetical protein
MFFGGNQATEDALVSGGNPGIFFGMAWTDHATELIDQQSLSNIAFGSNFKPKAISCAGAAGGTIDYQGTVSFDSDGFTVTVNTSAPGSRLIHYLMWGDFAGSHGSSIFSNDTAVYDFALDYRPQTGIGFHHWITGAARDGSHNEGIYYSMGVGNWPTDLIPAPYGHQSNALSMMMRTFSQLGAIGYTQQFLNFLLPSTVVPVSLTVRPWIAGSILTADDKLHPYPNLDSEAIRASLHGYPTRHSMAWWAGEGSAHLVSTPALGAEGTYTARPNVTEVEAALFFGTTGYGSEQILGPNAAYTFGVLTPDYQGCVGMDTGAGNAPATGTPGFFQSKTLCYVENIRSPGVRAASGEIIDNQVILTGEIQDAPNPGTSMLQLYGPGEPLDNPGFFRIARFR